jgi:hypothetical protein
VSEQYKGYTLQEVQDGVAIKWVGGLTITNVADIQAARRWVDIRVPAKEEYRGYVLEPSTLIGGVAILELKEVQYAADMNMARQWVDARVGEVNEVPLDADTYHAQPSHVEQEALPVRDKLDAATAAIQPCQTEPEGDHFDEEYEHDFFLRSQPDE